MKKKIEERRKKMDRKKIGKKEGKGIKKKREKRRK